MRGMREVEVTPTAAGRFEAIIGGDRFSQFSQLADTTRERFLGRTIWNINAAETGGVAEMLRGLVATAMGLGIDTRWLVIDGNPEFFAITKRIHNTVHGSPGDGGPLGDIVVLHDPPTAGLVDMAKDAGALVVWCCHIGVDVANESTRLAWDFLSPYVAQVDAVVFSRVEHVPASLVGTRTLILPPAIDPFAVKNIHFDHQTVVSILSAVGLVTPPKDTGPATFPKVGATGTITRPAKIVREGGPLDPATPLVVQISRWDRLKDMLGVMTAFAEKVTTDPASGEAHLALVGPDVEGGRDDPEGLEVLQECVAAWHQLPAEQRRRISGVLLPM